MAKVLVLGGAGFVGSQTAKCLKKAGHTVMVIDNLSTGHREFLKYGQFLEGNILDERLLRSCYETFLPDVIMNFAALALVGESAEKPECYYECNVSGMITILKAWKSSGSRAAFIFSSTCSVYAAGLTELTEESPMAPINPYARTKMVGEMLLKDFASTYGLRYCSLRYFNAAGSDSDGEIGELHTPETHLIPRLLLHVKNPDIYPVQIFGNDYPTPDGTCVRDYIHVEDLAKAHIGAMNYLLSDGRSEVFNLGSGRGHSVKEVMFAVEKITGSKINIKVGPRRAGDPPYLVASNEKASRILHWNPVHGLDVIVNTAWDWIRVSRANYS